MWGLGMVVRVVRDDVPESPDGPDGPDGVRGDGFGWPQFSHHQHHHEGDGALWQDAGAIPWQDEGEQPWRDEGGPSCDSDIPQDEGWQAMIDQLAAWVDDQRDGEQDDHDDPWSGDHSWFEPEHAGAWRGCDPSDGESEDGPEAVAAVVRGPEEPPGCAPTDHDDNNDSGEDGDGYSPGWAGDVSDHFDWQERIQEIGDKVAAFCDSFEETAQGWLGAIEHVNEIADCLPDGANVPWADGDVCDVVVDAPTVCDLVPTEISEGFLFL